MDGYGMRILIIGDDLIDRGYLEIQLEQEGYAVHTALDGIGGADELRKRHFDAVIANCHMPGLGNAEFYDFFRRTWPDIPIILLLGGVGDLAELGNDLDGAACIRKPYETALLLSILRKLTQRAAIVETEFSMAFISS